ncbi:hypothetical protein N0V88_001415 [Collariella sp. IMI 366227]|nr:hypothetical protein N0V88_001415 [Collariella sp. IMI 366227]
MLAAHHDQENVYTHQAGASKQQLQAKTPGARYPKTPLKVPLNDENTNHGFGGKSVLRAKGNNENILTVGKGGNGIKSGKEALVTPAPRTARAPLGNKTTNAKARATHQTPGAKQIGRDIEKTNIRPTSNRRLKQAAPQIEAPKLEVHTDRSPLEEEEIEYAPPKPKELPYESDVFPDGVLTFDGLKPENLFKGYYQYYHNRVGEDGKTIMERQMEQRKQESFKRGEDQILKDMDEFDWSVGDIPESKDVFKKKKSVVAPASTIMTAKKAAIPAVRQPSTFASRRAASALAMPARSASISQANPTTKTTSTSAAAKPPMKSYLLPKRKAVQPVSQPTIPARERAAAAAASRSTLGYNKGRSMSSAVHGTAGGTNSDLASRPPSAASKPRTLMRSVSTASTSSDATITPARFAQSQPSAEWKKPDFLAIFDTEEDESNLGGGMPPVDDDEDDFQLTVNFH